MKLLNLLRNILSTFFMLSMVAANNQQAITILGKNNTVLGKADILKQDQYYLSVNDLGKIIGSGSFVNEKTEKIVRYFIIYSLFFWRNKTKNANGTKENKYLKPYDDAALCHK